MFEEAANQLKSAEIFPDYANYEKGKRVVHELLKKESISEAKYYQIMGPKLGKEVLAHNVFALHFNSGQITFQSTVMKQFCKENSTSWEEENKA
jgi:hypothetical protein